MLNPTREECNKGGCETVDAGEFYDYVKFACELFGGVPDKSRDEFF